LRYWCFISDKFNHSKFEKKSFIFKLDESVNKKREKRKYKPPNHCELDLQINKDSSIFDGELKIEKPVVVNPEIDSK